MDGAINSKPEAAIDATSNLMSEARQYGMEGMLIYWISVLVLAWLLIWFVMDILGPMLFGPPMPPYYYPYYYRSDSGLPGMFSGGAFQNMNSPEMARLTYNILSANPANNIGNSNGYVFT